MTESEEEKYELGSRKAYESMLNFCIRALGYLDEKYNVELLLLEREQIINALRNFCENFGDNDWEEDLWVPDIIEKHLHDNLHQNDREVIEQENLIADALVFGYETGMMYEVINQDNKHEHAKKFLDKAQGKT